uniref:Uncharacterized protein n=1 Tax=Globodera pallida TaxID=36090 RepID=A0A183CNN1_GLOPA
MASPVPNNSVDTSLLLCNPNISPKLSLRPITPRSSTASTPRRHTVFACSESKRLGRGPEVIPGETRQILSEFYVLEMD